MWLYMSCNIINLLRDLVCFMGRMIFLRIFKMSCVIVRNISQLSEVELRILLGF